MVIRVLNCSDLPPGNNIRVQSDGPGEVDFVQDLPNGKQVLFRMTRFDILCLPDADDDSMIGLPTVHLSHTECWQLSARTVRAIKMLVA